MSRISCPQFKRGWQINGAAGLALRNPRARLAGVDASPRARYEEYDVRRRRPWGCLARCPPPANGGPNPAPGPGSSPAEAH